MLKNGRRGEKQMQKNEERGLCGTYSKLRLNFSPWQVHIFVVIMVLVLRSLMVHHVGSDIKMPVMTTEVLINVIISFAQHLIISCIEFVLADLSYGWPTHRGTCLKLTDLRNVFARKGLLGGCRKLDGCVRSTEVLALMVWESLDVRCGC